MKKTIRFIGFCCLTSLFMLTSCTKEEGLGESRLDITAPNKTELDKWIDTNFVDTYNMQVFYRWDPYKVDMARYLTPVKVEQVKPSLQVIKTIWLDSYLEMAGDMFVKKTAPRELVLVGSMNMNTTATITLGLAEQGVRISLFDLDRLNTKSKSEVEEFIHTIQHEYVHILNQSVPFNEGEYGKITAGSYRADWNNATTAVALSLGFISNYARSNVAEDFAEQASWMLKDIDAYELIVNSAAAKNGKAQIREKEAYVVDYYKNAFGIDFYALCRLTTENTLKAINL